MFKGIFKNALRAVRRENEHKLHTKDSLPYRLWATLTRRKAAAIAPTRQCIRRALTKKAFWEMPRFESHQVTNPRTGALEDRVPLIRRAPRRAMARAAAKNLWRRERGLVAACP